MFTNEQDYISLALDEESFKAVHLRFSPTDQKVIEVTKRDIREVSEEELLKVIQSAIGELRVKKPVAICTIPASMVTTKNIEIPSLDPDEINSIIDLQAGRHTPYSREEILVGYLTIGVFQRNYTKVLLIIVNRDVIKKQLGIFQQAGARVEKVLFGPEGVARFYADALNVQEEDAPLGIIDIAHQTSSFSIEFNRTVATCRSIPIGMGHLIKEGQEAQEKLIAELQQSIESYQNEDIGRSPETYILTSDDAKVKELQPILQEKLKANIKVMPYLDHIHGNQEVMLKLVSEFNDDSFLSLVAVSHSFFHHQIDLTPDEIKMQRTLEEKGKQVAVAGACGIVLLILMIGIFTSKVYFKSVYLDKLKQDYIKKRRAVMTLDRVAQKSRIIKDYLNSRMVSLKIVDELYYLTPNEIYLENIFLDEKGTINIRGVSESMSRVFNFVTDLEESELFKSVKATSTTAKKDRGKDVAAFEIVFKLESAKDEVAEEQVAEGEEIIEEEG